VTYTARDTVGKYAHDGCWTKRFSGGRTPHYRTNEGGLPFRPHTRRWPATTVRKPDQNALTTLLKHGDALPRAQRAPQNAIGYNTRCDSRLPDRSQLYIKQLLSTNARHQRVSRIRHDACSPAWRGRRRATAVLPANGRRTLLAPSRLTTAPPDMDSVVPDADRLPTANINTSTNACGAAQLWTVFVRDAAQPTLNLPRLTAAAGVARFARDAVQILTLSPTPSSVKNTVGAGDARGAPVPAPWRQGRDFAPRAFAARFLLRWQHCAGSPRSAQPSAYLPIPPTTRLALA